MFQPGFSKVAVHMRSEEAGAPGTSEGKVLDSDTDPTRLPASPCGNCDLLVVGLAIAITFRPEKTRQRADEDHMVQTAVAKTKSAADLALIKVEPDLIRGHRSNYVEGTFSISNGTDTDIKDMKITCYFIAPSGTALGDDSTTIYEVVPAGSTRKTRNVPLGYANSQTVRYKCDVTDFQYEFSKTR